MSEGLSSRLKRVFLLGAAFGLIGLSAILPAPVSAADPTTCNTETTGKAHEAGLKFKDFTAQDTVDQTFNESGVDLSLAFVTPKSVKKIPKVELYAKDDKGTKTDITPRAVTRGKEDGNEVTWTSGASLRMKSGVYTFHAIVTATIEGLTHTACTQTKITQIELGCGKADSDLPFDKSKSVLRTDGSKEEPNKRLKFIRYATTGRRCYFSSQFLDFREGTLFRILKDESESHLRSTTDYALYYTGTSVTTSGPPWHGFIAVDKQTGIFADVVFRKTAQASNDSQEEIYSWNASVGRDATSGLGEWKVKLLLNLRELRGQKVQGFVTGKKREIHIKADFDIDYTGSEAATKNKQYSGKQTTLPEFNESVAEMQLWCAYDGQGKDHLFIDAFKFDLPTNPSDGKWDWKREVYSGSCIVTSFLTLTNDGKIPLTGGDPTFTAHPKYGINTDRTFEDALGNATGETTDALYLGVINRGREDLWAADLEFKVDADTTKAVPDLNPIFTHRATTTDVYAGNPCGILSIVNDISLGVGAMLTKLITCIMEGIFKGIAEFIEPFFQAAGTYSQLTVPVTVAAHATGPPGIVSLTENVRSFIAPTAWAQPTDPSPILGAAASKNDGFEGALKNDSGVIVIIWKYARSLLNIVVVIALLAIAFANILHLNINTYAAKKMLPGLVLGVIGANASLLIIRFLADITQAVSHLALEFAGVTTVSSLLTAFPIAIGKQLIDVAIAALVAGAVLGGGWGAVIVILAFIVYYLFILIAFLITMLKRAVILYFLTMASPLAFLAYGIPQFQKYFFQWWDMFLRHLFVWPVVLFGMAMTITISNLLGAGAVLGSVWSAEGIVKMFLVLGAAHFTLHLPKIITKGTIDAANILKKTLGTMPRAVQSAQSAHNFAYGGGKEKFKAGLQNALGLRRLEEKVKSGKPLTAKEQSRYDTLKKTRDDALETARQKRLVYGKGADKGGSKWNEIIVGKLKAGRGYAKLMGDPEVLQTAYADRIARQNKDDFIASVTKTQRIPSKVRGTAAEAELAKKLALEEMKEARTKAELRDWRDGLGKGHLDAIYNQKDRDNNLWRYIEDAAKQHVDAQIGKGNMNAADRDKELERAKETLRQKFGTIGAEEGLIDFIEKEVNEDDLLAGGLGIANRWDIHDLMKVSGFEKKVTDVAKSTRKLDEGAEGTETPLDKAIDKRKIVDPYDRGSLAPPFAGGDPTATQRVFEDGAKEWAKKVFSNASSIAPHINDELESQILQSIHGLGALDPNAYEGSAEAENLRTALMGATGGNPMGRDALTREIFNADSKKLLSLAEQIMQASEVNRRGGTPEAAETVARERYNQSAAFHNEGANATANIDYAQLSKVLGDAVAAGNADLGGIIAGHLSPELEKMTKALGKNFSPEVMGKIAQEFSKVNAAQLQAAISGRDQRSLMNVLKNTMETSLTKSVARALDTHVPSPEELVVKVESDDDGVPDQTVETESGDNQTS